MNAKRRFTTCLLWAALAVVLLAPATLLAQTGEGVDPMRQITTQIARPNILIVMDCTGSMAWDMNAQNVGTDDTGSTPSARWETSSTTTGCSSGRKYTYILRIRQTFPSRMCVVKNVLGNAVTIKIPYSPGTLPANKANWSGITPTYALTYGDPNNWTWTWVSACRSSDPGYPIDLYYGSPGTLVDTTYRSWPFKLVSGGDNWGTGGDSLAPSDIVGQNADQVNWGLTRYSTDLDSGGTCTGTFPTIAIDANDTGIVTDIQNMMRLNSAGGAGASGSTNTRGALNYAATVLQTTYNNDPKIPCGRAYGTILVTDGLSNSCNPSSGNWISPCIYDCNVNRVPGCCDGGSSGSNCPDNWTLFPPEKSQAIWNLNLLGTGAPYTTKPHTWVIGVSESVSPCELNYTAYRGRTDASSPNNDAGFMIDLDTASANYLKPLDYRLPDPSTAVTVPVGKTAGAYDPTSPYAFFATSATALRQAFSRILAGIGAGNYTTAPPSVSSSSPTTSSSVAFLSSVEYPTWKGHLYAYDLARPNPTDPNKPLKLWDAAVKMNADPVGNSYSTGRSIWTWNPSTNALVEIIGGTSATDANIVATVNTLNTICGSCGVTPAVVDYIRGNDGTFSGVSPNPTNVKRSWLLGSIINSTPAIIGPPSFWRQGTLTNHAPFETTYANRHDLVWVGADDMFLHAFDIVDGHEVIALLPPEFIKNQVQLYTNFAANNNLITGQPEDYRQHIYGVANSPRYADVNLGTTASPNYATMLFINEGPGKEVGSATNLNRITGINVTHPYPGRTGVSIPASTPPRIENYSADANFSASAPVSVTWKFDNPNPNSYWSVPAVGATTSNSWLTTMGSGFNPWCTATANTSVPFVRLFNANVGTVYATAYLGSSNPTGALVGNQAFADSVIWKRGSGFNEDNLCTQVVQADLAGRLWFRDITNSTPYIGLRAGADDAAAVKQPIYYSPAVGKDVTTSGTVYAIYAYTTGSFFERSLAVSGYNIGTGSNFIPKIWIHTVPLDPVTLVPTGSGVQVWSKQLNQLPLPAPATTGTLGQRTQTVSSPILFVPGVGDTTSNPFCLFLLYDPYSTVYCAGETFVAQVNFDPANLGSTSVLPANIMSGGEGAASGFTISNNQIYVAKSKIGAGQEPELTKVGPPLRRGSMSLAPNYWLEMK